MRGFWGALSFLTVFPVPDRIHRDREALRRALGWYPVAGLLVGGVAAIVFAVLHALPPLPRAVVAVLIPLLLTRMLHLDGFADTCDGLGVSGPAARRLAVMRDPRLGTFGVAGVVVNLLWRVAVLSSPLNHPLLAIVAAPVIGRFAMVLALRWTAYGAGGSFGAAATRPTRPALLGASLTVLLLFPFAPLRWLASMAVVLTIRSLWTRKVVRQFGALTGDTLGALNELAELAVLLVFLIPRN